MHAVSGPSSGLDVRMQEAARRGIDSQREDAKKEKVWRHDKRQQAKQLSRWLHEVEVNQAAPVMRAIAKAEKVAGHRLLLRIGRGYGLCSRGFRIVWEPMPPSGCSPIHTTTRLKNGRGLWDVVDTSRTRQQVLELLNRPNLEKDLVYQGIDEWPTLGKICFWGAFLGFPSLGLIVCAIQDAAYNRAYTPAVF